MFLGLRCPQGWLKLRLSGVARGARHRRKPQLAPWWIGLAWKQVKQVVNRAESVKIRQLNVANAGFALPIAPAEPIPRY
jgi:hypothetical protein